jgi:putative IMPACT (imprinted ancient) family translation regulator
MNELIPEGESLYSFEILSSRFIALLEPLANKEDLESSLAAIKKRYPGASHYCYAAKVRCFEACSDDGEPARSAGLPFLDLLRKKNIAYGFLVVVRYFGGTKLGASRLARVYRETAAICVNQAAFAEIIPALEIELSLDYSTFERLKKRAEKEGISVKVLSFDERVRLLLRGDAKIMPSFVSELPPSSLLSQKDCTITRSKI